MKQSEFETGLWAKSWDEIDQLDGVVGTANLLDDGVFLEIPCGHLLDEPGIVVNGKRPESRASHLYGYTRNNNYLVLHDAEYWSGRQTFPGLACQRIHAKELYAAKGHRFDISRRVVKMEVYYSGLSEWYHKTGFESAFSKESPVFESLRYDPEKDLPVTLYEGADLSIVLGSGYVLPPLRVDEMIFRHVNYVTITFTSDREVLDAVAFAQDFSSFLSLCMGAHASIESMSFFFQGDDFKVDYFRRMRGAPSSRKLDVWRMPFPYAAISDQLPSLIGNWLNAGEGMGGAEALAFFKHAAELVVSVLMYDWDMPVQPLYVSASQALEALARYRAMVDDRLCSLPDVVYRSYRKRLKNLINNSSKEFRDWVMGRCNGNEKGMRRLVKELCKGHSDLLNGIIPDVDSFIKLHLDYRNRCAHPSPAEEEDIETVWYMMQAVSLVSDAIVWSYLGLSDDRIINRFNKADYKSFVFRWLNLRFGSN